MLLPLTLVVSSILFLIVFASLSVDSGVVEDKYSCPHGWTRYGNKKCLKYVNELQDYERAQATCRQKNQGTLVTIHTHDEQNFVYSYIHSIAASSTPIWLGAKQIDFESILWLDKTENSYVNWAPSEPSHPDEICIAINPRTGMWHDVLCTEANVPACERAPTTQWPFFVAFCSEGWFQFNDEKCVRIISSQALNFYESQELCRSKYNSKLLSIKTDKESEFVHNLIKFRDVKLPVWLGAVQNDFSSFNWIDKSDVTFTNWAEGEPNDPDHACISMQASGGGKWSDNDCKEQKLILCQKIVPEDGSCETGWLQFRQDKCYRFVHVRLAFDDAETLCNNLYGGHLPSIHSQEEQFMISQFLASVNVKNGSEIWLGGRQMDFHNFNWGDGSLFNYSYWEQGEPSFPAEKCIEMSWRNGRWNDINCRLKRAVLCERQMALRHHIKPNLYQSTTCLNVDSNCTTATISLGSTSTTGSSRGGPATPVNRADQVLVASNSFGHQQEPGTQPLRSPEASGGLSNGTGLNSMESLLSNKSNASPVLEQATMSSNIVSQSNAINNNNNNIRLISALPLPTDDRPVKVITSIMNRSESTSEMNKQLAESIVLSVPSGVSTNESEYPIANGNNSFATGSSFIHYNLPPPDRVFSPVVDSLKQLPSASPQLPAMIKSSDDSLQAKQAVVVSSPSFDISQSSDQNQSLPDEVTQQFNPKNSPPAPIEHQIVDVGSSKQQELDKTETISANDSSLLDKIKPQPITTGNLTTSNSATPTAIQTSSNASTGLI